MIITTDLNIVRLVELRLLFPPQIHKLCHGCAQFLHVPCDFLARKVSLLNKTQAEGLGTTEGLLFGINFSLNKQTNKTKTLRAQTHKKRKQTNKQTQNPLAFDERGAYNNSRFDATGFWKVENKFNTKTTTMMLEKKKKNV